MLEFKMRFYKRAECVGSSILAYWWRRRISGAAVLLREALGWTTVSPLPLALGESS
jgi:hypothetical protein